MMGAALDKRNYHELDDNIPDTKYEEGEDTRNQFIHPLCIEANLYGHHVPIHGNKKCKIGRKLKPPSVSLERTHVEVEVGVL